MPVIGPPEHADVPNSGAWSGRGTARASGHHGVPVTAWKIRSPLDPVAYAFGVLILVVALFGVQGPIVGAILLAAVATGSCLVGVRILYAVWQTLTRQEPPER